MNRILENKNRFKYGPYTLSKTQARSIIRKWRTWLKNPRSEVHGKIILYFGKDRIKIRKTYFFMLDGILIGCARFLQHQLDSVWKRIGK